MLRGDCVAVARFLRGQGQSLGLDPAALAPRIAALLSARRLRGGLVEVDTGADGWRIAALGLSAFVADPAFDAALRDGDPDLCARFLTGPDSALLDGRAQARGAEEGLNLVVLAFHFDPAGLQPELVDIVLGRALDHFVAAHRGFPIKAMLRADPEAFLPLILQTGLRQLGPCRPVPGLPPMHHVGFLPQDRIGARPGGVMQMLIHFGPPLLGCTVAECRVLDLASAGLTDPEIAEELGLSASTVKAVWRSVHARAVPVLGLGAGRADPDPDRPVRGAEMRSRILLHLRDHPQDMRPFRPR